MVTAMRAAYLHEEEDHLARDVAADAIHIHVAPPSDPAPSAADVGQAG